MTYSVCIVANTYGSPHFRHDYCSNNNKSLIRKTWPMPQNEESSSLFDELTKAPGSERGVAVDLYLNLPNCALISTDIVLSIKSTKLLKILPRV